jgi:hypothetical protein
MTNERMPPRGFSGFVDRTRKLLSYELINGFRAARIRRTYGLEAQERFSGAPGAHFRLAIVAIFKGEDEYLREWIEFHRIVGVEHFFLYDNADSAASRAILAPYVEERIVTYTPFAEFPEPGLRRKYGNDQFHKLSMQNLAYGDCSRKYARRCDWLAKIDLDEFLYPLPPFDTLPEALKRFARRDVKGFSVMAARFGPSGRLERPELPVIESYRLRYPEFDRNWKAVGSGGRISGTFGYQGCHNYFYKLDPLSRALDDETTREAVRINHYVVKSRAEYLDKIIAHSSGHKAGKESPEKWTRTNEEASFQDEGEILRFLPALKERLANRGRDAS